MTKIYKADLILYAYVLFAFIFLVTFGIRAVEGEIDFEFYADSETYIEYAKENIKLSEMYVVNPNMFGPTIILWALNESYFLVFFLNISILFFMYFSLTKYYSINRKILLIFFLMSPVLFGSLIAINKEIISLLSCTLFLIYYKKRSFILIIMCVLVSLLVRWQMAMFVIVMSLLVSKINVFRANTKLSLAILLVFISAFYFINLSAFESVNVILEEGQDGADEGSGLFHFFVSIQNSNPLGYIITWIPKVLFLFIGLLARISKFFDFSDMYNNFIAIWQCLLNFIILFFVWRKKVSISNIFVFCALVYSMVFGLSPIFSPRYMFPIYVFLALAVAENKKKANF